MIYFDWIHYHVLRTGEVPDLYSFRIAWKSGGLFHFFTKIIDRRVLETTHCASCLAVGRSTFKQSLQIDRGHCYEKLPARSNRQGWSDPETSSKIYQARLRLGFQFIANAAFTVLIQNLWKKEGKFIGFQALNNIIALSVPLYYQPSLRLTRSHTYDKIFFFFKYKKKKEKKRPRDEYPAERSPCTLLFV